MNLPAIQVLTVCGLDDLADRAGVTHVLSILDPGRPDPEAFGAYGPHHRTVLRFHDAIAPGEGIVPPGRADIDAILAFGDALGPEGEGHLLVHCHMGISRSTAALATLLAQAHPDEGEDRIVERLLAIRPQAWPNSLMIALADRALGRGGRLDAALARLYARQLGIFPRFDPVMRGLGRAREVEMGRQAATSQAGSNQRSASPS
jgi:predicted protein tyrosine phosphatase